MEKHGKTMEKSWKNHGKTMEKPWKNHGKPWKNHGKTMEMFIWKVYFHRNSGARETKPEFQQKKHIFAEHIWMILQEGMDQKITSFFWMEHDGTIVLVDHRVFLF